MTTSDEQFYLPLMKKMVDVLAHDVRNPLNNILLSTAQFKMETLPDKDDSVFYIDIIERNCDRVNQLLSELLEALHPPLLSIQEWDIEEVLKDSIADFEDRFSLKNIKYRFETNGASVLPFDRANLKIAFRNIIQNAVDAMPNGGELTIEIVEQADEIVVIISDTGLGINQDILPQIFAPFFSTKERRKGLGLCQAKNITNAHNGKIAANSEPNKGTVVQLFLNK